MSYAVSIVNGSNIYPLHAHIYVYYDGHHFPIMFNAWYIMDQSRRGVLHVDLLDVVS